MTLRIVARGPTGIEHLSEMDTKTTKLVNAAKLPKLLFDKSCRPSLVWLAKQRDLEAIPHCRSGRRIFYEPVLVHRKMIPGT